MVIHGCPEVSLQGLVAPAVTIYVSEFSKNSNIVAMHDDEEVPTDCGKHILFVAQFAKSFQTCLKCENLWVHSFLELMMQHSL